MKISNFDHWEHQFLSNFWAVQVMFEGVYYPTVEHAYVAAKTLDLELRKKVLECDTPRRAKRLGRTFELRPGWEEMKLGIMLNLLRQKFAHPELKRKLLATGSVIIEEGNNHKDTYWGVCNRTGKGQNYLGKLLMGIREELRYE